LLQAYQQYSSVHSESLAVYEKLQKKSAFSSFLEEVHQDPQVKSLPLEAYLIKPVQRVCKYPLFIRDLIRNTDPSHPDYKALIKAREYVSTIIFSSHSSHFFRTMESLLTKVNAAAKDAEVLVKMVKISKSLSGCPDALQSLIAPGRRFIREGWWHKITKRAGHDQERYFFMFTDMLLYCKKEDLSIGKRYIFKGILPYAYCTFSDEISSGKQILNTILIFPFLILKKLGE